MKPRMSETDLLAECLRLGREHDEAVALLRALRDAAITLDESVPYMHDNPHQAEYTALRDAADDADAFLSRIDAAKVQR